MNAATKPRITLAAVRLAHAQGMTDEQMAAHFGVSLAYMRRTRSSYNLKPNHSQKVTAQQ